MEACARSPVHAGRVRKSVGAENTFSQDLHAFEPMREALEPNIAKVWRHCQATGIRGRTVTLKVKFADFQRITRSKSVDDAVTRPPSSFFSPLSSLTQAQATGRHAFSPRRRLPSFAH